MKFSFSMNKRGDFESLVYVIISIFAIGFFFLLFQNLSSQAYEELSASINETSPDSINNTAASSLLRTIQLSNNSAWDWAFLGLVMGYFIALLLTAYAVRISPAFYWMYGLLSLISLGVGVILSNTWQELSADPEFAATIAKFPIMNSMLGSYAPLVITALITIAIIALFAKPSEGREGYI